MALRREHGAARGRRRIRQGEMHKLELLSGLSRKLRQAKTTAELASALCEEVAKLISVDAAVVWLEDEPGRMAVLGSWGLPKDVVGLRYTVAEGGGAPGLPGVVSSVFSNMADTSSMHARAGVELCVPLRTTEGDVLGTLWVGRRDGGRGFGKADEELLHTAAEVGANALQRARSYEELSQQKAATQVMAAMAAHEIRRMVENVILALEAFERVHGAECGSQEAARVLGWAIGELEKLGRGAQDLMDVIGLEVGALRLEQEQVEVGELLEDVARAVAGLAGRKRQSVRVDVGQAAQVLGDPGRLRQALANLVRNALQASGEGAAVDLRARVQEGEVIIEVQDYGTGIPKDELERVWEPFFRSAGRRREYPGHGLGLTVAKMIAEKHGGRIEVESELGRGSTFRLILPQLGGRPNAGQPQAEGTR